MTLDERILNAVADGRDELVELATDLIAFDTTARSPGEPARDEAALQRYLADRLAAAGAAVDVWEPDSEDVAGTRQIPDPVDFAGRPQLAATFAGSGGGRSLLLNGHIDVVPSEPRERWTSDPNRAAVRDGNLYGRGACDMKGGVAAMAFAAEVLARLGVRLRGDLVVNTVTDEESSGAGGLAAVRHGVRADAGIVTEPTAFELWTCCRGSLSPTITVDGRPGHAEMAQPHWRDGGAVNAIEKLAVVLDAVKSLRESWLESPAQRHPHLSPGDIVPVLVKGGEWAVTSRPDSRASIRGSTRPASAGSEARPASAGARAASPGRTPSTSTSRSTTWCAVHRGWLWPLSATVEPMHDSSIRGLQAG